MSARSKLHVCNWFLLISNRTTRLVVHLLERYTKSTLTKPQYTADFFVYTMAVIVILTRSRSWDHHCSSSQLVQCLSPLFTRPAICPCPVRDGLHRIPDRFKNFFPRLSGKDKGGLMLVVLVGVAD